MPKAPTPIEEYAKERVGERVRLLLEAKGLRQNMASEMMERGMTPQKLNNYVSGREQIPVHWAGRLCAVTGANFSYIYGGDIGSLPADLARRILDLQNAPRTAPEPRRRVRRS